MRFDSSRTVQESDRILNPSERTDLLGGNPEVTDERQTECQLALLYGQA